MKDEKAVMEGEGVGEINQGRWLGEQGMERD
jgi:hypothetical protein